MCTRQLSLVLLLVCCWKSCNATVISADAIPTLEDIQTESEALFNNIFNPKTAEDAVTVNCGEEVTTDFVWQNPHYPKEEEGLSGLCVLTLTPPEGTCGLRINFDDLDITCGEKNDFNRFSFVMSHEEGVAGNGCQDLTGYEGLLAIHSNDTAPKVLLLQISPKVAFKFRINATLMSCDSINDFKSPSICGIKNDARRRRDLSAYELDEDDDRKHHNSRRDSPRSSPNRSTKKTLQSRKKELVEKLRETNNVLTRGIAQAVEDGKVKVNGNPKIIPVNFAGIGEWPWMVAIERNTEFFSPTEKYCPGVLLDTHHVLAAFSCISNIFSSVKVTELRALLGEHDVTLANETLTFNASIAKITFPLTYDAFGVKEDVAILTLKTPVEFSRNIRPICLPADYNVYRNDDAMVMGWPVIDDFLGGISIPPSTLSTSEVRLTNETYCESTLKLFSDELDPNNFMCAVPSEDELPLYNIGLLCNNDAGTPLVRRDQTGAYFLKGLRARASFCGLEFTPSIYERVDKMSGFLNLALA